MLVNVPSCLLCPQIYIEQSTPVTAGDQDIPQVDSLRLLGVTLQNALKWGLYVDNRVSKANSGQYFLVVLKRCRVASRTF